MIEPDGLSPGRIEQRAQQLYDELGLREVCHTDDEPLMVTAIAQAFAELLTAQAATIAQLQQQKDAAWFSGTDMEHWPPLIAAHADIAKLKAQVAQLQQEAAEVQLMRALYETVVAERDALRAKKD